MRALTRSQRRNTGSNAPSLRQSKRVIPPPSWGATSSLRYAFARVTQATSLVPAAPIATAEVLGPGRTGWVAASSRARRAAAAGETAAEDGASGTVAAAPAVTELERVGRRTAEFATLIRCSS